MLAQSFWWFYAGLEAIAVFYLAQLSRSPWGVPRCFYQLAIGISLWSGLMAVLLALGAGQVELGGQVISYARYLDCLIATPGVLLSLCWTGMLTLRREKHLIHALLGMAGVMVFSSWMGDLSTSRACYLWYANSGVAFGAIMKVVWGFLRETAQLQSHPLMPSFYDCLAAYLTVSWGGYALVWVMGSAGWGVIDPTQEAFLFCLLSFAGQTGFLLFNLYGLRRLNQLRLRSLAR
uniref:Rhodopsin n=1 Tax=Cyanothece sp. (strain PCC 7425 / ATCC 29141) TaxID=395961 RepID=B8HWV7_CYAP4